MEETTLHPVREARGWLFDPAEVSELKTARMASSTLPAAPISEGRLAARVFYLFDHGRELPRDRRGARGAAAHRPVSLARVDD